MELSASQTSKPADWRERWVVSNWLAAVPLLRTLTLTSGRDAVFALGADALMIAGMVIGMDLGSDEVVFLDNAMALSPAAAKAEFGHLISIMITVTMVLGMAAGMILWTGFAPLLGLYADQPEESGRSARQDWRDSVLVRRAILFVPCLRALCERSVGKACLDLCADGFLVAGMLAGMAVVHELAMGSATPVRGLPMALAMAVGMALGMGAAQAAWNTVLGVARACRSILLPIREQGPAAQSSQRRRRRAM
jgi:hypothetical protein